MIKLLDYAPIDKYGEPTVKIIEKEAGVKLASSDAYAPEIREFIQSLKPVVGKLYALINAMGATEYFSCNRNGDAFYEDALKKYHHTFVEDGHAFMHHKNKDPEKSYGKVIFSAYNDRMHRVELIVEYDTDKLDKKFVDKINNGDLVNVSMGCKVDADYCSICGHKAKTPAEYCEHLKSNPGLTRMLPDGRKAFAINRDPHFFDISIVTIPADPTARVMAKIAGGDYTKSSVYRAEEEELETNSGNVKTAGLKEANGSVKVIMKDEPATEPEKIEYKATPIDGKITEVMNHLIDKFDNFMGPSLPSKILDSIGSICPNPFSIFKSLINHRIFMRPHETQRIMLVSLGHKDLADKLDKENIVCLDNPDFCLNEFCKEDDTCDEVLDELPDGFAETRELSPSNIKKITLRIIISPDEDEKIAGIKAVPVQMSDDFLYLLGRSSGAGDIGSSVSSSILHGGMPLQGNGSAEIEDIKRDVLEHGLVGSFVAAVNTLLGGKVPNGALWPMNIAMLMFGPKVMDTLYKPIEAEAKALLPLDRFTEGYYHSNAPVQEMQFMNPNRPEFVEAALADALLKAQSRVKISGFMDTGSSEFGWLPKAVLALPIAYGASKLINYQAKQDALEEAQQTGVYKPGLLSKTAITLPLSYATILKFASAQETATNFVKKAHMMRVPLNNLEERLENILFED